MKRKFKVGDHVRWNSEAGQVSGRIIKVHTKDFDYKGYTHHAKARAALLCARGNANHASFIQEVTAQTDRRPLA